MFARLHQEDQYIETVLIRHETPQGKVRYTVCVSSQVGCSRACSFCATGTMGLQAQLSSGEILEQVWMAQRLVHPEPLRNVVFMGMVCLVHDCVPNAVIYHRAPFLTKDRLINDRENPWTTMTRYMKLAVA